MTCSERIYMLPVMRNLILATSAAVLLATAPAAAAGVSVSDAWVRLPAVSGRPAAAYFTVMGGAKPQTIVGVSSPSAKRGELHESAMTGGLMKMAPVTKLAVGKGQMVKFAPGGKHVMLFDLDPALKPGATIKLNLQLAGGEVATADAKTVGVADSAPAPMEHHYHQ